MRGAIVIGLMLAAGCGSSAPKTKASPAAPAPAPAKVAAGKPSPAPLPAEPAKTKPDPHALFQAAAAAGDVDMMIRINREVGIADEDGAPNDAMEAFINAHTDWAMANAQWIMDHATSPESAAAWLRANYDPKFTPVPYVPPAPRGPPATFSAQDSDNHRLFQAAANTIDIELIKRVTHKLGLTDRAGVGNDKMEPFMLLHNDWALQNADWIMANSMEREQGAAYIRKNFDKKYKLPPAPK